MTEATEIIYSNSTVRDPDARLARHLHLDGCPTVEGDNKRVEVSVHTTEVQGKNNQLELVTSETTRCCDCGGQKVKILSRD